MTRVYLVPGLFGFTQLAGFDYMKHLEAAVLERFRARAMEVAVAVVDVHPLASIRRRAARLVDLIDATAREGDGPIHLLGHSVGGLDARLAASPTAQFPRDEGERRQWLDRLCSVTSLNSPHYGSPGGAFFATSQGQRVLYAVSAITISGLRLGSPPLAVTSALVAVLSRSRERSGFELRLIDRIIEGLRRALDDASRREVEDWLRQIREDQGAIAQLTPEAMDLFQAGVEDKPGLRYQCVATYAPARRPRRILRDIRKPWLPLSGALFHLLYRVAAVPNPRYSFAPPDGGDAALRSLLGEVPPHEANDGIVPLRSQLWGELAWAGQGDHLDVVGHFDGPPHHGDWLNSGSRFGRAQFDSMMDRVVEGMWAGEAGRTVPR